ncbi:MAG: response regulator [Bacteroidetes bacterium]|jgi:CheY-like chemotaxis protein|nr:response regulator [Bacteroidota bacterium]
MKLDIAQNVPSIFYTDDLRLKQIVSNLIDNAIKYTDEGEITVSCTVDDDRILLSVKDTGIGISAEYLPSVFDRFTTVHHSIKKVYRGAGLGLSISKQLANLLGGDLDVTSELKKGSEFILWLPRNVAEESNSDTNYENEQQISIIKNWQDKTALIVEDEESNYKYLKFALLKTNIKLLWAKNGSEAMDIIRKEKKKTIDIVLLDIKLPDYDGFQVFQMIRGEKRDVPVIAQTAFTQSEDERKIKNAGFNDFLAKPISLNLLIQKMEHLLSK